ncbi:IgA-binding beta antigen [Streptococcus pneumoniae]|nr:IgA-binding beta antigen [Streptococcus pneumoniae]
MFASKSERKVRYSIRKFSVGVASVVVASLFLGGVVHAEVVGGGNTPTVISSGQDKLKEYRQQLIKELEDTDLSSSRKAYYQKQIETETDAPKLMELENNFHNESRIEHEQAVEQASVSLSMYMTNLLNELDSSASGFGDILKQAKGIVQEYREKIGGAYDREKIEKLQQEGQTKLDELVKKFKKGLSSSEQNGHATPKDPSQNDGVQGDDSSVGQGEQPGASNQENPGSVPPTASGETDSPTKPKTSNDSENSLERELKEAKETAKTTLDNYRKSRLTKLNPAAFWFGDLLLASQKTLSEYSTQFESASSKEEVKALIEKSKRAIDELIATHQNREIDLERNKAKAAVTKHLTGLLDDIKKNLEKDKHINNVDLIKKLKDIEKTYLHKLDELTQTDRLQELVTESQSKLDEALSKFKKGLSSSSSSGSSTKPEIPKSPEKPEVKPTPETPEVKPVPQPAPPKPEVKPTPETPEVKPVPQPAPPKTSKIFIASNGKTKVTVVFDKAVDADKVNIKEVTTKEVADKISRKTGGGTVRVFDLSLSKEGKETHINGERIVRLALGQTGSDVHVYHVKENGDLERIPSIVENGQVVFKTNHFSLFAIKTLSKNQNIIAPKQTKPSIQGDQVQVAESQTGKFQNKEVNPKPLATGNGTEEKGNPTSATEKKLPYTGVASNLVLEIIGILGLVGTSLIAMKRRK